MGWSRLRGSTLWQGVVATALLALIGPVPLLAAGPTVPIRDYAYQPATITIVTGKTITWRQEDIEQHSVSACTTGACPTVSSLAFDSGTLTQGESFSFTFSEPGTYPYYCKVHTYAIMHGTVVVTAAAASESRTTTPAPPSGTPQPTVGPTPTESPSSTVIPTPAPATLGTAPPPTTAASPSAALPSAGSPTAEARANAESGSVAALLGALILLGLVAVGLGIVLTKTRRGGPGPPKA